MYLDVTYILYTFKKKFEVIIIFIYYNYHNKLTNIAEEDAKRKWRNLRDTFLKEKKKVKKCRSGDSHENAEIYTGKWIYYKLMLFLKDTTTSRNTKGNISDEENTQKQNSDLSDIEENEHFSGSFTGDKV